LDLTSPLEFVHRETEEFYLFPTDLPTKKWTRS
jgi:hypothetical protein